MSAEQKYKSSVYGDSSKMCREAAIYLNVEFEQPAVELIAELAWKKLQSYGEDLEAFHKHGKRSTITADDVLLLTRKNPSLKDLLNKKLKDLEKSKPEVKVGKRKRKEPV